MTDFSVLGMNVVPGYRNAAAQMGLIGFARLRRVRSRLEVGGISRQRVVHPVRIDSVVTKKIVL